ncbi:MAG: IPTL-CTERM sorting domain-containing protein [Deltaproteobacteria bacterium]|nr:IPTL-CTERM sorting domain-containing protein [Deltaproteobacteria bacterium]
MKGLFLRTALLLFLSFPSLCWGANALVVHDGTAGTNADILANLTAKLIAAAYVITPNVGVPGGPLGGYQQIWDIRYSNVTPLSGGDIIAYVAYLNGGGSLFVMGENLAFCLVRDNSIIALITAAGGGTPTLASSANSVTILAPFTNPNAIANPFTFLATGGTTYPPGSGEFISKDAANLGSGIVYPPGKLTNALTGSLIVVFDVNFLLTGADANSQNLTKNLIAYLAVPGPVPHQPISNGAPTLSEWGMIVMSLLLAGSAIWIIRRRNQAYSQPS